MDEVTLIMLLYVESEQLISLTFTQETGSKLDFAMCSGHGEISRLHPCILPRGLFISSIVNKHEKLQV